MLIFTPWRSFRAFRDRAASRQMMRTVADQSEQAFVKGMRSAKSGRVYMVRGRLHKASAPGEYPAILSGALLASMRTLATDTMAVIGTNKFYSKFLRGGTGRMARRRMSDDALKEGMVAASMRKSRWVRWKRL